MSNDHRLHGPVFINKKRCETYEQLYEVMLNSTDGTVAQLAQTFVNTYGNSPHSGLLLTLGTAGLFVDPFEESYQKDFKELDMEGPTSEANHAKLRGRHLTRILEKNPRPKQSPTVHSRRLRTNCRNPESRRRTSHLLQQ